MQTPFQSPTPLDLNAFPAELRAEAESMLAKPHAMRRLATLLVREEDSLPPLALARAAMALRAAAPQDRFVWVATDDMVYRQVPAWHWKMLQDQARSHAYRQAIEASVSPGMLVLEIGAGTGILAMMAARAGAQVVTIEANELMADIAKATVALNGFADQITVLSAYSTDLTASDLPRRADLLVHEILSCTILTEGMVPSVAHARAELLVPGAPLLPERVGIQAALSGDMTATGVPWWSVEGFDLSPIAAIDAAAHGSPGQARRERLSPTEHIGDIDLKTAKLEDQDILMTSLTADREGMATGVEQWMTLRFPCGTTLSNDDPKSHWGTCYHPFAAKRAVTAGDQVTIETVRGGTKMSMGLATAELASSTWALGL